jgi:hypothetical protein
MVRQDDRQRREWRCVIIKKASGGRTMKHLDAAQVTRRRIAVLWGGGVLFSLWLGLFPANRLSYAAGFSSPQECDVSTGQAHLDCLYHYIERQQKKTAAVEADVQTQNEMLDQMRSNRISTDSPPSLPSGADDSVGSHAGRTEASHAMPTPESMGSVRSPRECLAYSGAAHLNCLYAYIDIQREKNGNVEEELRAQKQMLGQLREQMDRQASASQDLQRRLAEREAASSSAGSLYVAPPIYPGYGYPGYGYPGYGYPGFGYSTPGLSLYFGAPGYYWGGPLYGPRFFGHRFSGHRHR